ncbi:MAG: F0F1 ATP synthase subunit B' [Rhodospirillales bacterium]|jgi:F-type H+-transporting ATPase subunit b|nr:F0F1 ATP synthase subunit B' [Rhodospirillales bacterium]MBT4040387.1 F0F1 ATP synthase subunit B' [Rhodospirillales bacterium]MBT4627296.1 F0F1 ATP synthase subunit B' [Rhodospirillales bacterium]MBT5351259.1 F0F1 ATP synthase subunit B' [Rhodospirillales bacterium]MBT5520096.1 F0F1 ATP synthase subunit B' [Rhodospirillales bacterium]
MPQLDISTFPSQIFWLTVTFAALFLIMWKVAVPRIADVLESRQRRIEDNLDKAAEFKKDAEAAIEAYENAIAEARASAQSTINEMAQNLATDMAAQEAALAEKLQARISESEAAISDAKTAAISSIRDVAQDVASSAVEKLVGDAPDASVVGSAIDSALKARS